MKPETAVKVQLNARVKPEYRKAANLLAAVANVTVDGFIEMLIRNAAEDDCGEAETFRKMRMVWKAVAVTLPVPVVVAAAQVMPEPELLIQAILTTIIPETDES